MRFARCNRSQWKATVNLPFLCVPSHGPAKYNGINGCVDDANSIRRPPSDGDCLPLPRKGIACGSHARSHSLTWRDPYTKVADAVRYWRRSRVEESRYSGAAGLAGCRAQSSRSCCIWMYLGEHRQSAAQRAEKSNRMLLEDRRCFGRPQLLRLFAWRSRCYPRECGAFQTTSRLLVSGRRYAAEKPG